VRMVALSRVAMTALLLIAAVVFGPHAGAHNRSQSFSSWAISDGTVEVLFSVKSREVTRLPPLEGNLLSLDELFTAHLGKTVSVATPQGDCRAVGAPRALSAAPGYVRVKWGFDCKGADSTTLQIDSFFAVAPSHVHYARIAIDEGLPTELLFTEEKREQTVRARISQMDSFYRAFVQYLQLGVEHIFGGADHIAFLLALLLLFRRLRDVVWVVSGFTVGHSVTLSLAALGLVVPDVSVVEAMIGFTIALVAVENIGAITGTNRQLGYGLAVLLLAMALVSLVWDRGLPLLALCGLLIFTLAYMPLSGDKHFAIRMRPLLTLVFGMIHGFGFASVLVEIGLPQDRLLAALAGFNIGVELGQIAIVSTVWFSSRWLIKSGLIQNYRPAFDTGSAALCGLGLFWFVSRSFMPL
jgi:hypothetical protein